jgi:S1-C subfamily serine protease
MSDQPYKGDDSTPGRSGDDRYAGGYHPSSYPQGQEPGWAPHGQEQGWPPAPGYPPEQPGRYPQGWGGGWPPAPNPGGWGGGGWGPPPGAVGQWGPPGWNSPGTWAPSPAPRHNGARVAAAALVVAVVAAVAGVGIGHAMWKSSSSSSNSATAPLGNQGGTGGNLGGGLPGSGGQSGSAGSGSGTSNATGGPADVAAIAAKISPALVDINTTLSYQQEQAAGTGIVLTSDGEVVTNNHVINGATKISVTDIGNGQTYDANVVGYDRTDDVAVLQLVKASKLTTASISNSSKVSVGQSVVAVGNAGGTGGTPSNAGGSVTALNQSITASDQGDGTSEQLTGLIQTNCNIQPGDSGGSLVNTSGQVVGIDTAASAGFSFQGGSTEGFSIPINKALGIVRNIVTGHATSSIHVGPTPFLGVQVSSTSGSGTGFGGSGGSTAGAQVAGVVAGGAAAGAGLVQGDTITSVGGKTVTSPTDLTQIISQYKPGQQVSLGWTDSSGQTHTANVTLGSGPPQ